MRLISVIEPIQIGDITVMPGGYEKPVTEWTGRWVGESLYAVRCVNPFDHPSHVMVIYRPVVDPQPEPEPKWFDLTPFGEHVLRNTFDSMGGDWTNEFVIVKREGCYDGISIETAKRFGVFSKFRCLLKDAPPELVAMASKPEWPKYYTTDDLSGSRIAYIIRCSQTQYQMMTTNGTISENVFLWNKFDDETRTEITKEKADAILAEKRPKPAEDPDEWVTQDRVPYRKEFDQCKWDSFDEWNSFQDVYPHYRHGFVGVSGRKLEVRCRRKDLPPLPQQPKTETVTFHECIVFNDDAQSDELRWLADPDRRHAKTGRTETREVGR